MDQTLNIILLQKSQEKNLKNNFLWENTEKYITFTVPIEKELHELVKMEKKLRKNISYILQLIDSTRFMVSTLSNLVNNLSKGIHTIKCKSGHNGKKWETCGIKYKHCDCFLETYKL